MQARSSHLLSHSLRTSGVSLIILRVPICRRSSPFPIVHCFLLLCIAMKTARSQIIGDIFCLITVAVLSVPTCRSLYRHCCTWRRGTYRLANEPYEDEDGQATEDSQNEFSSLAARIVALIATSFGSLLAISDLVFVSMNIVSDSVPVAWLKLAVWVCLNRCSILDVQPKRLSRHYFCSRSQVYFFEAPLLRYTGSVAMAFLLTSCFWLHYHSVFVNRSSCQ